MPWVPLPSQCGIKVWTFTQVIASNSWTIEHGMGSTPSIDVNAFDDSGILQKAFPLSVIHLDINNVLITWTSPRKGFVIFTSS